MSDLALSRRSFALGSLALVLGGNAVFATRVAAQDATAAASGGDLASLGLPTLDITVNQDSFDGAPTGDIAAGRYLVTATVADGMEMGIAAFMSPPAGMSAEDFLQAAAESGGGPPAGAEGSPAAMPEGSPEAGGDDMTMLPLFVYKATFAGGAGGPGGSTSQSVLDLTPGAWILWGDDPTAPQQPVIFNVTGDMPADLPEPSADITFTLVDFAISIDGNLVAGDHVAKLQNHGAQPHFVELMKGPDSMTDENFTQALMMSMGGEVDEATPLPFDPQTDIMPVWQTATQSIGTDQWVPLSLESGTYAAVCFFPTAGTGVPHAMEGMHKVFTVK